MRTYRQSSGNEKKVLSLVLFLSGCCSLLLSPSPAFCQTAPKITSLYVIDYGTSIGDTLASPSGFFFDTVKRELYVADAGKRRILIYDENGRFRSQIRLTKSLGLPKSLVVNTTGTIFLAPMHGSRILVLDQNGALLQSVDFSKGFSGRKDKLATQSIALGPDQKVYLLTTIRGVMKIDPETFEASPVELEILDEQGAPRLNLILDMTVDRQGNFLFGEMRPGSVVVFDRDGKFVRRFGESGGGPHQISRPTGVTVDKEGRVYVVSTIRDMVLVYDREGNYLREWGGTGTTKGYLYFATKIIYDGRNQLYTLESDLNRVQAFGID